MLLAINDRIKGWLGIVIVALIGLPFALWGIQSYIGGVDEQYAARIGDREISVRDLERDVTQLRQQQVKQNPTSQIDDARLRQNAVDRIINTTVLENATADQGYEISDQAMAARIRNLFARDGEFDAEIVKQILASQGMTIQMFEQNYRNELRVEQLRNAVLSTVIVSKEDAKMIVDLDQQKREISWLKLNVDRLVGDIAVSDEDINEYYNSHKSRFMKPAEVSIEYIELSAATMKDIEIDESQLKTLYEEYVAHQKHLEERKASHILIATEAGADEAKQKINDISAKLADGADFADLAREFSDDPGSAEHGGDLGWVGVGQMVKPFEDALYTLKKGEISDIVQSEFGYHIIKLDDIRSAAIDSFDEKRDELVGKLKQDAVDSMMYDMGEILANTAYENPDSLEPAAEALGLPIMSTGLFSKSFGVDIAKDAKIRKAAFSSAVLQQGENSELIELAPDHVVVLRIKDHIEAAPVPLADVRATIEAAIRLTRGQEMTSKLADEIIAKLKQGDSIDSVLKSGIENKGQHTIDKTTAGEFDRHFIDEIMSIPSPVDDVPEYHSINLGTGDVAVIILNKVILPETVDDAILKRTRAQYGQARAVEDFGAVLTSYKDKAEIQINQKVIDSE